MEKKVCQVDGRVLRRLVLILYGFNSEHFRKVIRWVLRRRDGDLYSKTLRAIFSKYHGIEIGMYSYGGCFDPWRVAEGTVIGRYCCFASDIYILNGNHPLNNKSLHPFFYNPVFGHVDDLSITRTRLVVGNDVWISQGAIITPSVSCIGDGAVVGAGSVVTEDVAPFAVVAGNPARVIKYRFGEELVNKIVESRWWDKSIEELKADEAELASLLKPPD